MYRILRYIPNYCKTILARGNLNKMIMQNLCLKMYVYNENVIKWIKIFINYSLGTRITFHILKHSMV